MKRTALSLMFLFVASILSLFLLLVLSPILSPILPPILSPSPVIAAEILSGADVFVISEKNYERNLYIAAGKTIVEGTITKDLVVFGGEVSVTGKIDGDVFLIGGIVDFRGEVAGDLRVIGGNVRVTGKVGGDLLAIGGEVKIENGAQIEQGVVIIGAKTEIKNNLDSDLKIIAARVFINGRLSARTEITAQNLRIGSGSDISGRFSYYAPQKFYEESGATISAAVSFNEISSIRETGYVKKTVVNFLTFWYLLRFITTLILAFILIYIFKIFTQGTTDLALNSFWKSLLAGILVILFAPLLIIILFVSLVALPIGFLLLLSLIFIAIISPAVSGIFIGTWAKRHFNKISTSEVDFHGAALGVVLLTVLQFVPLVGELIRFVVAVVAIGAMVRYIRLAIIR